MYVRWQIRMVEGPTFEGSIAISVTRLGETLPSG
jgi:hypothetical protein